MDSAEYRLSLSGIFDSLMIKMSENKKMSYS